MTNVFAKPFFGKQEELQNWDLPQELLYMPSYLSSPKVAELHKYPTLLETYSELASRLADERGFTLSYTMMGLLSEYGEVVGKYAKRFWHQDWAPGRFEAEVALEFGDLFWMTGVMYRVLSHEIYLPREWEQEDTDMELRALGKALHPHTSLHGRDIMSILLWDISNLSESLDVEFGIKMVEPFSYVERIEDYYGGTEGYEEEKIRILDDVRVLWWRLIEVSGIVTRVNPIYIMEANLQKLHSRKKRGVMKGNGDYR